jgi:ABC-type lipoprotein export system ATPase subunit
MKDGNMFHRILNLPEKQSFFLFGARGSGKSTFLNKLRASNVLYIDLLLPSEELRLMQNPELLISLV